MIARLNNTPTWLRRPVVTLVGVVLISVGLVLLVLPGPGLLVMAVGLAVLATEYPAAQRLLDRLKTSPPVAAARVRLARFRRPPGNPRFSGIQGSLRPCTLILRSGRIGVGCPRSRAERGVTAKED